MEAFLVSTGIVALAEMGDKTQLLSLVLAARFRKPWPIVLGIFVATVVNHALAGALGSWVTTALGPGTGSILMPASLARRTRCVPGSDMVGVPASDTRAMLSPAFSRSTRSAALPLSLCSWKLVVRVVRPNR